MRLITAKEATESRGRAPDTCTAIDWWFKSRMAATARFPPKITPRHIGVAMRRYEQVVCRGFMAKAGPELIPVNGQRRGTQKVRFNCITAVLRMDLIKFAKHASLRQEKFMRLTLPYVNIILRVRRPYLDWRVSNCEESSHGTMVKTSGIRNPAMAFVGTLSQYRRIQATRFNFTITSELYGQAR